MGEENCGREFQTDKCKIGEWGCKQSGRKLFTDLLYFLVKLDEVNRPSFPF